MFRYREPTDTQSLSSGSTSTVDASFCSGVSYFSEGSNSSYEIETEVGREALIQICCSSLSRLLDFPDSQLETLLGCDEEKMSSGDEDGGMNVARNIASSLRMMKRSIGSGLHALSHIYHHRHGIYVLREGEDAENTPDHQPQLHFGAAISSASQVALLQVITHMESFAHYEGIFRKSGSKQRVDQLVQDLGEKPFEEILLSEVYKPHDFASVLKHYFSELPEPLLLKRHLDAYMQTAALSTTAATSKSLQLLMLLLPPSHRVIAQHLLQLLSFVASCPESKMDAHNLALVFAPTLFLASAMKDCIPAESLDQLVSLLEYMIANPLEVFEVPHEVQVVAEKYCKRRETTQEEDIALDMCSTYCQQERSDNFHAAGQERAAAEIASLYEAVKNMPDGPQKTHFLKKFESKSAATPSPFIKKSKSRTKNTKENFATPKVKHSEKGVKSSKRPPTLPSFFKTPSSKKEALREVTDTPNRSHVTFATPRRPPCHYSLPTMSPMVTDV